MLILEPRASDDETPESEASIGTADSSENITMETEGANTELPGKGPQTKTIKLGSKPKISE